MAKKHTRRTATTPRAATPEDRQAGQRLRVRRTELKMSQQELGAKLGISFQQVQKYEKGVNKISASRLQEIAEALAVPADYFFPDTTSATHEYREYQGLLSEDPRFSIRLLRAYAGLENDMVRRHFVSLMESLQPNR